MLLHIRQANQLNRKTFIRCKSVLKRKAKQGIWWGNIPVSGLSCFIAVFQFIAVYQLEVSVIQASVILPVKWVQFIQLFLTWHLAFAISFQLIFCPVKPLTTL